MSVVNIATHLTEMAARVPHQAAIHCATGGNPGDVGSYRSMTFAELDDDSSVIASGLAEVGIGRGTRVALMVKPGIDLFALTFALFKAGAVPVMIDPGIGLKNLKACLARAAPTAFIGISAAHAARTLLGWGSATVEQTVTVGRRWFWGGLTIDEVRDAGRRNRRPPAETRRDEVAAILFTSGSTGVPKGAVYRHGNFEAQVSEIRRMFGIRPGEVDVPTFPLFALFDPALGMTSVIPHMDATRPARVHPPNVIEAVNAFGATTMFGSPALLNTVGRWGEAHGSRMPTMRRIMAAGAPLPAPVMRRMLAMLPPDAEVFPPYGATEALPVAVMSSREILGETWARTEAGAGVCVGRPVESIELRVIEITDTPIRSWQDAREVARGTVGEIVVRGPQVTLEYFEDHENTERSKITGDDGTVWHRMGDIGYLDDAGRLWFCGRKSHRVETGAGRFASVNVEEIFNTHPDVFRTALVGVGPFGSQRAVLCVELEPKSRRDKGEIIAELREMKARNPEAGCVEQFLLHPGFPVDIRHNAKIRREDLARWAQEKTR
jgi:acyl-CoA synthetase (AMP-forming)/AMP-acid ligase II